jgi:glutamine amidotransferase
MCELLAISSRFPVTVDLSLEAFSRHGGLSGPHKDGWGIAYYEAGDVRLIKDTIAASQSPWVRFVEERRLHSTLVISHIRRATIGGVELRNTQPFVRELGGRVHAFAHNGHTPGLTSQERFSLRHYRPVGDTDSEHAFCALLGRLQELWLSAGGAPPLTERATIVEAFAADLRSLGPANFLYTDSDALFVHSHRRRYDDAIRPPGLHMLARECGRGNETFATSGLTVEAENHSVVLFASVPLTDEPWFPLGEGTLVVVKDGLPVDGLPVTGSFDGRPALQPSASATQAPPRMWRS